MAKKKATPAKLNPRNYPKPKKWTRGFVSKAQAKKFSRTGSLRKFYDGMLANTPGGSTAASRLKNLPYRKRKK